MAEGFTDDYAAARARFLLAATEAGGRLSTFPHPLPGPAGSALALDVAWLGPADARRVLFASSGMHGFEGPAGSAVQCEWLEKRPTLPNDTAALLVHALNPWGFAYVSRLTENNVDLNRNFIDWSEPAWKNPYYHEVREAFRIKDLGPDNLKAILRAQRDIGKRLGPAAMQIAVDYGQYEDPEGITFGGSGPEFGHRIMHDHVAPMLARAETIGVIDWHTGVGAYGEVAILPIDGAGSANAKAVAHWWGAHRVESWKRSPMEADIEADPRAAELPRIKTGQMKQALARWLPQATLRGAVIEFGTERENALPDLAFIVVYERWLRFEHKGDRLAPEHAHFRALARKCFVPEDPDWRALVIREGPVLMDQALAGLGAGVV